MKTRQAGACPLSKISAELLIKDCQYVDLAEETSQMNSLDPYLPLCRSPCGQQLVLALLRVGRPTYNIIDQVVQNRY